MPIISGGGGNFNGGTIHSGLAIVATDPNLDSLDVFAPAGTFADSTTVVGVFDENSGPTFTITPPNAGSAETAVYIGSTAFLVLETHAAPASTDLFAGDLSLWFDDTNGASKLMVKAKSANGTVVTGSVSLA